MTHPLLPITGGVHFDFVFSTIDGLIIEILFIARGKILDGCGHMQQKHHTFSIGIAVPKLYFF